MEWITLAVFIGVAGLFLITKQLGSISPDSARNLIKQGAIVVDVRNPDEYQRRHLPGVVNIPSGDLAQKIAIQVPDKNKVILLHCLSGGRSGLATRTLKQLGYQNVFNLGSYGRAESIVSQS